MEGIRTEIHFINATGWALCYLPFRVVVGDLVDIRALITSEVCHYDIIDREKLNDALYEVKQTRIMPSDNGVTLFIFFTI